ncbi:MAG TPA: amino acid ABC transporter permease [Flexilinea sp.]|jgi:polar amino acid transport system permease protein|nr:MAG: L-cystine transport system permease protein TcyB [Chloroflexi bacterium ADurb.Bin344]HOG21988.1 amino acid ABC transporter permease [Flexilinea sp.]HOP02084.1 amino acid ABC transporter permease [Flexilinea sp.]HOR55493.1 amino acid ABC transporter permease [Flexilinea sp.]HOU19330.1 amino acid ABC transporter permease [Flexilinea sp.]
MLSKKKNENDTNQWIDKDLPQVGELSKIDAWWGLVLIVLISIILLLVLKPDPFSRILDYVSDGIIVTLEVTVFSFIFTMVLGLFCGLGRVSTNKIIYGLVSVYVEIIRGIPLLVQLLVWYFAFPAVVINIGKSMHYEPFENYLANPVAMAIIGISICYAAYMAEIVRAGIESLPAGQMEAARSLGMTKSQAMQHIILPQAYRTIMPAVGNEFISLLKDSSLVSVVAVADLTRRGREFMSTTFMPIETWLMVALLYLLMTLISARLVKILENKSKMGGR